MKRTFLIAATGLICFCYSCNDAKPVEKTDSSAKYKAANAVIYKAIETGDVSKLDSVLANDAIDHADMSGKDVIGKDSIKAMLIMAHEQIKNMKMEVLSSTIDGDYTMERVRMTGTAAVAIGPSLPVGSSVDITSIEVVKWKDGKAYEHWTYLDTKDVAKMMSATQPH